ncbi:FtsX-like permease family protein [Knoellia sp. S7-12]|uniref:FtsX-like permease family protein n=1 Tax=Knoellia sp. S7-12 TaxID=3126698 RepID=UPI0033688D3A
MTTLTRRGAHSGEQPPAASGDFDSHDGGDGSGRTAWGRLTGSWGIALRMARRDVRRHKGRSALIMIMVSLPTLLLVFAIVAGATSQIDGPEQIPSRMGNGVASLDYPQDGIVDQAFDPGGSGGTNGTATPIPGWFENGSSFDNAQAVSSLTKATAVPYLDESVSTRIGDRRLSINSLAIDPRPGLKEKVELTGGRLPERAGEVLVSDAGEARGLPTSGAFTVRGQGEDVEVEVVGTAKALSPWGGTYDMVVPQPFVKGVAGGGWILLGSEPVKWPEVKRLNAHGFIVYSADVLKNPPSDSVLSDDQRVMLQSNNDRTGTFIAIGGALLLIITTLLVGPAFAVSAARQRRTLALSASNGATTAQLRHTVLAQALVLGVMAALAGLALGVVAAWLILRIGSVTRFLGTSGPFEVPVLAVGLITLAAVASAIIAALLPARRLGRLDIVGVMKGQNVSPRPSKTVFLVGAVLAGLGGFAVIWLAASQAAGGRDGGEVQTVAATVALVVGAIMLAPMILVGIARLSSRLPVSLRMATRDAGRQRSRSVPAIAAILAGVAVLTMTLIASGSDEEQGRREYIAQNIPGDAKVSSNGVPEEGGLNVAEISTAFATVQPGLEISPVAAVMTDPGMTGAGQPAKPYDLTSVNIVPPGCTPEQSVSDTLGNGETYGAAPCHIIGTQGQGNVAGIGFTTTAEISRRLSHLGREADAKTVESGGVVIGRAPGAKSLLVGGKVAVMSSVATFDPSNDAESTTSQGPRNIKTVTVPAVEVELTKESIGVMLGYGMLASTELAKSNGWPILVDQFTVHDPAGPISQNLTERLAGTTGDEIYIETERGYQSPLKWIILVLIGIFMLLLLVITLTSTALTLAEQESDQATLAALGSGRGTRRVMAAAQAFTLCIIGAVLGVAVGIVPGIALAYPLTAQSFDPVTGMSVSGGDPILVFPWLILLGFAIAVPVISAGLAAAGIRKAPNATHRAA